MARPLEGVRILDLTWGQQGPYATVMLSDMGAEIIKIEPRQGEIGRWILPGSLSQLAPYFMAHSRGKRSVTIDVRRSEGREIITRFVKRVDAVVSNMRPGVMEKLGLGYDDLRAVNPRIVYATASAFGPLGEMAELRGFDIIGQAMGGLMTKTGPEGAPPMPAGAAIADQTGAIYLCAGILAALLKVARTGEGDQVDVSLYGCQLGLQSWEITQQAMLGQVSGRAGTGHPLISPISVWGAYATADGGFVLGGISAERFCALCEVAGVPELAEQYPDDPSRAANMSKILPILREKFRERPTAFWLEKLRELDVMTAPVQTYADVIDDPQAQANGYMIEIDHPDYGRVKTVGAPIQFGREPTLPQGPPPELGDGTEVYLEELGYSWDEISKLRELEVI
jgi:crotonobetainyl-CoA:carnitine CoA-transferase CaiB-like acyl-CoA transferase